MPETERYSTRTKSATNLFDGQPRALVYSAFFATGITLDFYQVVSLLRRESERMRMHYVPNELNGAWQRRSLPRPATRYQQRATRDLLADRGRDGCAENDQARRQRAVTIDLGLAIDVLDAGHAAALTDVGATGGGRELLASSAPTTAAAQHQDTSDQVGPAARAPLHGRHTRPARHGITAQHSVCNGKRTRVSVLEQTQR